jgi:SAM-dependent methyltransferase
VVGIDFSAPMVAEARRKYPGIEFQVGNAEALPFPDGSFDAVVMNFGMLHLGQPDQALVEAHRVLRSGGRLAFTVWAKPEETVGFDITFHAIHTHGAMNVPLPQGPPFFRFSDPGESRRTLLEVRFVSPLIAKVPQIWRLSSPEALFEAMQGATVRTAGLLHGQTPQALNAIRAAMRNAARAYEKDGVIELPMPAVLASATKPT